MPSPFDFMHEMRDSNENLSDKLDEILDQLLLLTDILRDSKVDFYGDGK